MNYAGKFKLEYSFYILFFVGTGLVYFFYNPEVYPFFPNCIFKTFTGLTCPGCGGQRALHELLHFNFLNAFHYNALLVIALPFILVRLLFSRTGIRKKFPGIDYYVSGKWFILFFVALALIFFFIRNYWFQSHLGLYYGSILFYFNGFPFFNLCCGTGQINR